MMNCSTICAATNMACTYQSFQVHSEVVWKKLGGTPLQLKHRVCGTNRLPMKLRVFCSPVREHRLLHNKQQDQRGSDRSSSTFPPPAGNSIKRKYFCCSSQPGHRSETENGSGRIRGRGVEPFPSGDTSEEIVGVVIVDHGSRRAESNQLLGKCRSSAVYSNQKCVLLKIISFLCRIIRESLVHLPADRLQIAKKSLHFHSQSVNTTIVPAMACRF